MATKIETPYPIFEDVDGQPLEDGYLYIGTAGLDPVTNPITVYSDASLSTTVTQPVRTTAGYPVVSGSPIRLYTGATDFSLKVSNKNTSQIHQNLNAGADYLNNGLITQNSDGVIITKGDSGATALSNADQLVVEDSGDAGVSILTSNTTTGRIQFGDPDDNDAGALAYSHFNDALEVIVGGAERCRFTTNGLTFNGDTAAANALDDYEEGSFTPVLQGDGGASGITYTTQQGSYVKIGKSVTCRLKVVLSGKTSITGGAIITGLPFTSSTLGTQSAGIAYYVNLLVGWASIQPFISANSTNISLSGQKTTGTTPTTLADADIGSTTHFDLSFTYEVA